MFLSPIYQYRQLYSTRPTKIHQLIHSRTYRASGIEHVINENDAFTFDVFGKFGTVDDRVGPDCRKIVAVKRDVDDAVEGLRAFESFDLVS